MYEKELQRILTASQNNALTFFAGGVSALSIAPTWKGLIHASSDKFGRMQKSEYYIAERFRNGKWLSESRNAR